MFNECMGRVCTGGRVGGYVDRQTDRQVGNLITYLDFIQADTITGLHYYSLCLPQIQDSLFWQSI